MTKVSPARPPCKNICGCFHVNCNYMTFTGTGTRTCKHTCKLFYMVDELATLSSLKYFSHSQEIISLQKRCNYFNGKSVASPPPPCKNSCGCFHINCNYMTFTGTGTSICKHTCKTFTQMIQNSSSYIYRTRVDIIDFISRIYFAI